MFGQKDSLQTEAKPRLCTDSAKRASEALHFLQKICRYGCERAAYCFKPPLQTSQKLQKNNMPCAAASLFRHDCCLRLLFAPLAEVRQNAEQAPAPFLQSTPCHLSAPRISFPLVFFSQVYRTCVDAYLTRTLQRFAGILCFFAQADQACWFKASHASSRWVWVIMAVFHWFALLASMHTSATPDLRGWQDCAPSRWPSDV